MVRSETSSSRDRCCAVVKRRRRRIWMIENKRSARRMAGFSSRRPIMQARHLPRPRPLRLPRRRLEADVAAEVLAEVGRRRMMAATAIQGRVQAAEQRFRLLLRAMGIAAGREPADELEQQVRGGHGGRSLGWRGWGLAILTT